MDQQREILWQEGATTAPLPPLLPLQEERITSARTYLAYYEQAGPIFRLPGPNGPRTILAGPAANLFTARYGGKFFTTREVWQDFDKALGNQNIRARDGVANRQRRARSARYYTRASVLDQLPLLLEITRRFTVWPVGASVDVHGVLQRVVAEQLGQVLTHYEMGEYLPDLLNYLNTAIATTLHTGRQQGAALTDAAYAHACERVNELGRLILAAHTATPRTFAGTDFIDALLARARQEPGAFSEALLARAALSPFLAGLNTVANSCSFLFYALLTQPQVLSRVQAEVDQALARGPLDWETLRRMQDLRGAVLETLRLYPVASGHRARVARPLTFAGYRLDVGDDLFVAMTVSHLLPHLFPEPERFDIERYRPPRNEHHQPGAFAPFGLGEHTCAGAGIAEVQMMVITATVLFTYQLALDPPDYALTIERDPTPFPGNAFRMRVVNLRHAI